MYQQKCSPALGVVFLFRNQNTNSIEHKHPYVHCSIIYNCQHMEAAKRPSVDEWIKQPWDIYIMKYYSAIKNK